MRLYKGIGIFLIILVVLGLLSSFLTSKTFLRIRFQVEYSQTWNLLKKEKFDDAYSKASDLRFIEYHGYNKSNKRGQFVSLLSFAGKYYADGNYKFAYQDMRSAAQMISDGKVTLSNKQQTIYNDLWDKIESQYNDHKAEYEAHDREVEEYIDKILEESGDFSRTTLNREPYVGMSYFYIDRTILGKHADVDFGNGSTTIDGVKYSTDRYYWKNGDKTIYSATVANMKVISVHDYRSSSSSAGSGSGSGTSSSSSRKKSTQKTTEFDPDDHDIDQYYEDYKDIEGFEDIDDAYDDFEDNPEYWDDY